MMGKGSVRMHVRGSMTFDNYQSHYCARNGWFSRHWFATGLIVFCMTMLFLVGYAHARDLDGRYAASPLKPWFDSLKSKNGPCCSDADGTALADVDWRSRDGHYQVRLEGEWFDVPNDALITEPNRAGRTMVWPFYLEGRPQIRCFMPGSMT